MRSIPVPPLLIGLVLASLPAIDASPTAAQQPCATIRFQRGHNSGTVEGVAPANGVRCYLVTAGDNQTATLTISGRNVMFSIEGVVDAQDSYQFKTRKKTYKILVGQLMRSLTDQRFTLDVSVR